ncbi:MAG TPA: thioredoxin [Methylomirabilota bacterium]|nr:thioredoxin [Methylomirabilota bacterium]
MAGANVLTITEANFQNEVLQSTQPVLVDFWAEWCGPCKMIGPVIDELATEYQGRAKVGKVNVDHDQGLASKFRITGIPTLLVFKGGQVVEQIVGARPKKDLKASLDRALV